VPPVSDNLLELLMLLDSARGAAAREVHAIIPYYSYARSDKKDMPRISIAGRLIADLLHTAGATHVMTMTLHSPQVHGFFSVPTDHLTARGVFVDYFKNHDMTDNDTVVVATDIGHAKSAARFAKGLGLPVAAGNKTRLSDHDVKIEGLVGAQIEGFRRAIIYDDEIATGGSVKEVCQWLVGAGVQEIIVTCTHGLFIGPALERLAAIPQITEIVTTDTVPIAPEKRLPNMTVLSVASVFGEAMRCNYLRQSIGGLFSFWHEEE
jgi:ribose-phosphate pyrophosphokinase